MLYRRSLLVIYFIQSDHLKTIFFLIGSAGSSFWHMDFFSLVVACGLLLLQSTRSRAHRFSSRGSLS